MNNITEQIASSINIADLIGQTVKLRPSSRGYVGLCPFHHEKTPSFHVYTDTQSYYCFGCHKGGNIFTYVMETENVTFPEALQILADRAGIDLSSMRRGRTGGGSGKDILKLAEDFFIDKLKSPSASAPQDYVRKRSLTGSDIDRFRIGYAPDSWDALTLHLRRLGFSDKAIKDAGLAASSERGRIYDRFRGRIMFPIHSVTGRTVAFGGRIITGDGAKYINSPESETYRKRSSLYLLDMAGNAIREKKRSILCEGYMDAIRLQKSGFREAVASLGTSLTGEQAELLSRYADRCYICYDSDTAGQNAAIRGMYILQAHGLDVRVIKLPEGKDPDEYLLSHTPSEFETLITEALPLILAHLEGLRSRLDDTMTRKSAIRELFSSLETLTSGEVLEYKAQLCEAVHLMPSELDRMLITKTSEMTRQDNNERSYDKQEVKQDNSLECALCAILMRSADIRLEMSPEEAMEILNDPDTRALAYEILNEDVSALKELWLMTGDTSKLSLLERGNIICSQIKETEYKEKFVKIYADLKRVSTERKITEINTLPPGERNYDELRRLYSERGKYSL